MMEQINLEIGNMDALMAFVEEAKRAGLLKDLSLQQVRHTLGKVEFPVRIPIPADAVFKAAQNPIIRKAVNKKLEDKTIEFLNKVAMGAGR